MTRNEKKGNLLRSVVVFLTCAVVLAFALSDYLVPLMEGWEINDQTPEKVWNWILWAIDMKETP